MQDFSSAILLLRYGARSFLHQLECLPVERLDWKPEPSAKSPLEIAEEVARAIRMYLPMLRGAPWEAPTTQMPANVEAARALVTAAVDDYIAALEAAGPELERPQDMPFGATFWAPHAALYPVIEVHHHHGQLCYIQSLLGDTEMHWDEGAIEAAFVYHPSSE